MGLAGRREGARGLRDALHLTKAGDDPGPAGNVLRQWSRAVARPISVAHLARALEGFEPERIALCLDAAGPTPVDRAAQVIEAMLTDSPRAETAALILADAASAPVARADLARVVAQGVSIDLLIEDLKVDLEGRPYEVAQVCAGWMLRTKPAYAPAIRAAADVGGQALNLSEVDLAVLAAIAFHQPISRDGLKDIFGKEISRDLIGRLAERDLIGTGPREPRRGAPYKYLTTDSFFSAFGMQSLRDLHDPEQAERRRSF